MPEDLQIQNAELWVIEPPRHVPEHFSFTIRYLINAGVDLAIGPNYTLPQDAPKTLDGIRMILITLDDVARVGKTLQGFRGFRPQDLNELSGNVDASSEVPSKLDRRQWFCETYLNRNETTWLAVYGNGSIGHVRRLESPLLMTGDLSLNCDRLRTKLLRVPDRSIRDVWIEELLQNEGRVDWNHKARDEGMMLLDDYELFGDRRCLEKVKKQFDYIIHHPPTRNVCFEGCPLPTLIRVFETTNDDKYLAPIGNIVTRLLDSINVQAGSSGWCHAAYCMSEESLAHVRKKEGDMGTLGELMMTHYLPLMSVAKHVNREEEIADKVASCVKTQRDNLRDDKTGLYWHGLAGRRAQLEGFVGHGLGWSCYCLSQLLDYFPADHPARADLVEIFREQCEAAARFQGENGGFHSVLNLPWTPLSAHYTAWFGFAFAHGVRMNYLDASYLAKGVTAWEAVKSKLFRGKYLAASGGTPVSRRMEYYLWRNCNLGEKSIIHAFCLLHEIMRIQVR